MLKCLARLIAGFNECATLRIGITAVALLAATIATREAKGSCGDYLVIGGAGHAMDQSGGATHADAPRMPVGFPCEGPQCRQSPNIPVPPAPAEAGPGSDKLAFARRLAEIDPGGALSYRVAETLARPVRGFPFRLERPPHA